MTIFRGTFLDCPADPFAGGGVRVHEGAVRVVDGAIAAIGAYDELAGAHSGEVTVDLREGLVLPGFVDTHVHFPQVRIIGGIGMPLLEWLDRRALPEEARLADPSYAAAVAAEFVSGLIAAGTTSALVFGSHFAAACEEFFAAAERAGLRATAGLVVSDRELRADLLTDPARAEAESLALAQRWHGRGRLRYAVTPRFALSCGEELLAACGRVAAAVPGSFVTSHVNENPAEVARVRELTGTDYVDSYDRHGLVSARSVYAHDVHPTPGELARLAERRAVVAHCPTSNAALGSGLFPLRAHVDAGVRVALGSDVGAGAGFSLLKEGLQASFVQRLLGATGWDLGPAHLLWLATAAGADALDLPVGVFEVGRRFDAVRVRPAAGTTLDVALRHAVDAADALAMTFALGTPADLDGVWIDGQAVSTGDADPRP